MKYIILFLLVIVLTQPSIAQENIKPCTTDENQVTEYKKLSMSFTWLCKRRGGCMSVDRERFKDEIQTYIDDGWERNGRVEIGSVSNRMVMFQSIKKCRNY